MKKQDYLALLEFLRTEQIDINDIQSVLFRGLGQLKAFLFDPQQPESWPSHLLSIQPIVQDVYALLHAKYGNESHSIIKALKSTSISSYFTPIPITKAITSAIDQTHIQRCLEPSAGTGNFLRNLASHVSITALEPDPISFKVLQKSFPNVNSQPVTFQEAEGLGKFDLIVSNIPFGNVKVFDRAFYDSRNPIKIASTTRIHNYFFTKAIDHLSENGMIAFITSSAFADSPSNESVRQYLMTHASLLAIVRLPGEVFSTSGTQPTCDLMLLQKHDKEGLSERDKRFIKSDQFQVGNDTVPCNELLAKHPELMIGDFKTTGQYGNAQLSLTSDKTINEIADLLLKTLQGQILVHQPRGLQPKEKVPSPSVEANSRVRLVAPHFPEEYSSGQLYVHQNKVNMVQRDSQGLYLEPTVKVRVSDQLNQLLKIRNCYLHLLHTEQEDLPEMEALRSELNVVYDRFVFQYGCLNHPSNKKLIRYDSQSHLFYSLENQIGKQFIKSDIFRNRITHTKVSASLPDNLADAIIYSINEYNKLDLAMLESALSKTAKQIIYEGVECDLLYLDHVDGKWSPVTKDALLSGDIYSKVELIINSFPSEYEDLKDKHLQLVKQVTPPIIPFELIDINLGERWIDTNIYERFLTDFFEVETKLIYLYSSDRYELKLSGDSPISDIEFVVEGKTEKVKGKSLMQHAFSDTSPVITYPVPQPNGDTVRVLDHEAIRASQDKIVLIYEKFQQWVAANHQAKEYIETTYNRMFNNIAPRSYDGSHLKLEGLHHFTPHPTQKNAVYRNLQQNGGINDHMVGAGKTLVMAISAFEMRRLGIARKPLIIAKNANVSAIYEEFMLAYPQAKVLHPSPIDFRPENRRLLFQRMMNNDWDCIIISHEQFKMIPQSREIQSDILQEEIKALESDLEILNDDEGSHASIRQLKGLEKRKENMEAQLQLLEISIKRDPYLLDFQKLGFDHLFIDESQEFKNLLYTTRHSQVSGLGNPKGSQRAFNLLLACRTIQRYYGNSDKGITFLSGTTISNSLVELYLLFKYLRPEAMKQLCIPSFDAWAKVYARKSYDFEFSITNEIKRKERYREFIKVPELSRFYTDITDVVNDTNFSIAKPKVINEVVNLAPTASQKEFMKRLVQFARTKDGRLIGRPRLSDSEEKAYMLIATNYAKKMSLDMRLIRPDLPFERGCKLDTCASKLSELYHMSSNYRGTQLVFCDHSTPSNEKWNVYHELRTILVRDYGIPIEEIAFIHDAKNPTQKKKLYDRVNNGEIRILIGSTTKMGVGVNVQKRVIAMHHLDIPWRPSDFEQRTGRGGRQGNWAAEEFYDNVVFNFIYAVERSLDSYQFNLLSNKQKFINQIKDNSISLRKIDEGAMSGDGDNQQMNFAEYVALLSGNQNLLQKVKIEKQLKDLEMQYNIFVGAKTNAKYQLENAYAEIDRYQKQLQSLQGDKTNRDSFESSVIPVPEKKDRYYYPRFVTISGQQLQDPKIIGQLLLDKLGELPLRPEYDQELAQYGDFKMLLSSNTGNLVVLGPGNIGYTFANGLHISDPVRMGKYIKHALDKQENLIFDIQKELSRIEGDLAHYKKKVNGTFEKSKDILALKAELSRIEQLINVETEENEAKMAA